MSRLNDLDAETFIGLAQYNSHRLKRVEKQISAILTASRKCRHILASCFFSDTNPIEQIINTLEELEGIENV